MGRSIAYAFRGGVPSGGVALAFWRERRIRLVARSASQRLLPATELLARRAAAGGPAPHRGTNGELEPVGTVGGGGRATTHLGSRMDRFEGLVLSRWNANHLHPACCRGQRLRRLGNHNPRAVPPTRSLQEQDGGHSARPSPTRDEIAFVSDRDGSSDVFLADLDGSAQRSLQHTPDHNELAPRWSPDGEFVVVTRVAREVADFGSMSWRRHPHRY